MVAETKVDVSGDDEAGVGVPIRASVLWPTDVAKGLLHAAGSDTECALGEASVAIALGEDLEERNGVADGVKERGDVELTTEVLPRNGPSLILCVGALRNDGGATRVFRKAEVSAEFISGRR